MKPRYHTEAQILNLIDRAKTRVGKLSQQIEALEQLIDEGIKRNDEMWKIGAWRDQIMKLERRKERIVDHRLQRLKLKLAEIRIPLIPAMDDGNVSVPI